MPEKIIILLEKYTSYILAKTIKKEIALIILYVHYLLSSVSGHKNTKDVIKSYKSR